MKIVRKFKLDGVKLSQDCIVTLMKLFSELAMTEIDVSMENDRHYQNMTAEEFGGTNFNNIIIEGIYIHSYDYDKKMAFYLKSDSSIFTEHYEIVLEGENELIINDLEIKVRDWITNNTFRGRKKYATLNNMYLTTIFYIILFAIPFNFGMYNTFFKNAEQKWIVIAFSLFGVGAAGIGIWINDLALRLFPNTEFLFGYNTAFYKRKYFWGFIVLIVLPFIFMVGSVFWSKSIS